jgi:DNA-binding transcriptional MerR regulator
MALGEAKVRAKNEIKRILDETGTTLEEVRAFVQEHPEMQQATYQYGHKKGCVGVAANFVAHAAERMKAEGAKTESRQLVAVG